jgi:DNA mismatch repair protein MutL
MAQNIHTLGEGGEETFGVLWFARLCCVFPALKTCVFFPVARAISTQIVIQDVEMVAKELLENALDAGASRVRCAVWEGGAALRVSDDGPGMAARDLARVGSSHSTSKLASIEDLRRLATYGFRGEGLHAIASQALLRVASRQPDAPCGFVKTLSFAPGAETDLPLQPDDSLPVGTTVTVENLFGTLPVRRQVMLERQDAMHKGLLQMFTCYALAHPSVSFHLEVASKAPFVVAEARSLEARCTDLYGPNVLDQLERVRWVSDNVEDLWEFDCLLPKPNLANYDHVVRTKARAFALVNKRPVKLDGMLKLINRAFRAHSGLGSRKYPLVLLSLTLPPDTYDINLSVEKSKINLTNEAQLVQFLTEKIEDFYPPIASQQSGRY